MGLDCGLPTSDEFIQREGNCQCGRINISVLSLSVCLSVLLPTEVVLLPSFGFGGFAVIIFTSKTLDRGPVQGLCT